MGKMSKNKRSSNKEEKKPPALPENSRPGHEKPRSLFHLLEAAAAALLVATVLFPGESLLRIGSGHLLTTFWFFAAAFCALLGISGRLKRPKTPQDEDSGTVSFRLKKIPGIAILVFFLCVALSVFMHLFPGSGSVRYGLNALFLWTGLGACFYVFRGIYTVRSSHGVFFVILISLGVAQSGLGLYQYVHERPALIRAYEENKERELEQMGIAPGSNEQILLENRIRSNEPLGTYPLTNTLAGLLAPLFILILGGTFFAHPDRKARKKRYFGGMIAAFPIGLCLFFTQSRTAMIAVFCGLILLVFSGLLKRKTPVAQERSRPRIVGISAACALLLILIAGLALKSGGFPADLISGAKKSLGYRLEYWFSTGQMIRDYPLFGCGAGNFQQYYTAYKLPIASEEIADPHNFLLEIWSNFGTPAVLAFCVFLLSLFWTGNSARGNAETKNPNPNDGIRGEENRGNSDSRKMLPYSSASCLVPVLGALLGFAVAFFCFQASEFPLQVPHLLVLFACFGFSLVLLSLCFRDTIFDPGFPSKNLLRIVLLVLLINLLGSGGIGYMNIAVLFWGIAAVLAPSKDCENEKETDSNPSRNKKRGKFRSEKNPEHIIFIGTFFVLGLLCYHFSYYPSFRSAILYSQARETTDLQKKIPLLEKAAKWDRFCVENQIAMSHACFQMYQFQRNEAWIQKAIAAQEIAVYLAPRSATIHRGLGTDLLHEYEITGNSSLLKIAIKRLHRAVELYPNQAKNYAPLATAYRLCKEKEKAISVARKALELDDIMPHRDQKLLPDQREKMEQILASNSPP